MSLELGEQKKKRGHNLITTFCGWGGIKSVINKAKNDETKLLMLTLWNTGGRISEVLELRGEQIKFSGSGLNKNILVAGMHVLKTKMPQPYRNIPIPFTELLVEPWAQLLHNGRLFNKDRIWAWRSVVGSDSSWWPHRFRTERASQLVQDYGFDVPQLMKWFGWSTVTEAVGYTRLSIKDLLLDMQRGRI
jgi:integrase